MFLVYYNATNTIVLAAQGTHTIADFPNFNVAGFSSLSADDSTDVLNSPFNFYIDTSNNNNIRVKKHLELVSDKVSIQNDGADTATLTVSLLDVNNAVSPFVWKKITTGVISDKINDVFFISNTVGYACGDNGKILKTVDGGTTWVSQITGTGTFLQKIFFIDANIGWSVGSGTILHTINGGTTWTPQTAVPSATWKGVFFTDASNGWIVGDNEIQNTVNGGATWVSQYTGAVSDTYNDVVFQLGGTTGYVVGNTGIILYTANSGGVWTAQTSGVITNLQSVTIGSAYSQTTTAFVSGGAGDILKTINSGTTWTLQTSGTSSLLTGIYFDSDLLHGWTVSNDGFILSTIDGGTTWVFQTTPDNINQDFTSVFSPNTSGGNLVFIGTGNGELVFSHKFEAIVTFSGPTGLSATTATTSDGLAQVTLNTVQTVPSIVIEATTVQLFDPITSLPVADVTTAGTLIAIDIVSLNLEDLIDSVGAIVHSTPSNIRFKITVDDAGNLGTIPA